METHEYEASGAVLVPDENGQLVRQAILVHAKEVTDDDPEFVIDPDTKKISASGSALTLPQRSKNSERLTFYMMDKIIEGHDMSTCNQVLIHFRNIDAETMAVNSDIYKVEDLAVNDDGSVTLSWLVDDNATQYAGGLIFSIHFMCVQDDGTVVYDLPTLTFSGITVGETVWNSNTIAREYPDIIAQFEARISALEADVPGTGEDLTVTAISVTEAADGSVTIVNTLEGGSKETIVISADANGNPAGLTYNGVPIPFEWVVET